MHALGDHEVLAVWTSARNLHAIDRTLALLAAGCPGASRDELAALPLGERNARALELRERMFGTRLDGFVACPRCAAALELSISTRDLATVPAAELGLELEQGDYRLVLRKLDSRDLAAIARIPDREAARAALVDRTIASATRAGEPIRSGELPADVVAQVAERLAAIEPLLDTRFQLACPACEHAWSAPFDPGAFLWHELAARARRVMLEVHQLAQIYGWSERDVLAVPAARRLAYLELAGG